ncbi:MAG: NAD(P)H-dependent oxidoreductase [Verrucomicrobiaceae bacterium]|nr:MAG: NAD(P)H-dependent oxidoreductase [Verrucomicrobiaceae bacterium]
MTVSTDTLLSSLRWRYATKSFDASRKIPAETWDAIEESLVLTPSSFGLQPWKFLVIQDPGVRSNLLAESWRQSQVTDASHFVVLAARTDLTSQDVETWISRMSEVQGAPVEALAPLKGMIEGFAQAMSHEARHAWNMRQCYIALGQLMATAAALGIDTCPMEGLDSKRIKGILKLPSDATVVMGIAVGRRSYNGIVSPRIRLPDSRFIKEV